jgi:uncharacterized protein
MSAEDNLETIKGVYEAFGRGDVDAILAVVTDDVDWSADADSDAAPWYGQRQGKDEVARFFQEIAGALDVREFTPLAFAASDSEVMALIRFGMAGKESGREGSMHLHHYFRFRDGRIEYYRGSEDTAQTVAVLGG